jgi:hypothetical protein
MKSGRHMGLLQRVVLLGPASSNPVKQFAEELSFTTGERQCLGLALQQAPVGFQCECMPLLGQLDTSTAPVLRNRRGSDQPAVQHSVQHERHPRCGQAHRLAKLLLVDTRVSGDQLQQGELHLPQSVYRANRCLEYLVDGHGGTDQRMTQQTGHRRRAG